MRSSFGVSGTVQDRIHNKDLYCHSVVTTRKPENSGIIWEVELGFNVAGVWFADEEQVNTTGNTRKEGGKLLWWLWTESDGITTSHTDSSSGYHGYCMNCANPLVEPHGCTRGQVRGVSKPEACILWKTWMSIQNWMSSRQTVVQMFSFGPEWWTDCNPQRYTEQICNLSSNSIYIFIPNQKVGGSSPSESSNPWSPSTKCEASGYL